jgi:hypothetical protein
MALRQRIWSGLLLTGLAVTGGCGVQDPDQPPVGSISVRASRDDDAPSLAPGRSKTAPANHK